MKSTAWLLLATVSADIVMENELIISNEVFDLKYALDSDVEASRQRNETQLYCIFRSKWTKEDHPAHFPKLARFSTPVLFSHTKQYTPFLKNREANYGVKIIAEVRVCRGQLLIVSRDREKQSSFGEYSIIIMYLLVLLLH